VSFCFKTISGTKAILKGLQNDKTEGEVEIYQLSNDGMRLDLRLE
jgi:hypothetical protein